MKKILAIAMVIMFLAVPFAFADRNTTTIAAYGNTGTLVKLGNWKLYRVTFTASVNGGQFCIYDETTYAGSAFADLKVEGGEATAKNSKLYDFTSKPLEGNNGLVLEVSGGTAIVEYE
jgi:hypothetical protein